MQKKVVKVEFGIIQDIEKMVNESESIWKSANSKVGSILRSAKDKVQSEIKPMVEIRVELFKIGQDFETKADQLGLSNADKNKYLKSVDNAIKAIDKRIDSLEEVNRLINMRF